MSTSDRTTTLPVDGSRQLIYIGLFAVSGFSGLIYESIWSNYLKLFLGHAALAQSLVLIIFMGGMALGAWGIGRYSQRITQPLLVYAAVEALIGVAATVFHPLFVSVTGGVYDSVLPGLESPLMASTLKWVIAAALILPQSIALGMTFPLMAAGILRRFPHQPGKRLAVLYFANSLGAAIGVLVAGFVMIKAVGLPGTIRTAGVINIVLALTVWLVVRIDNRAAAPAVTVESTDRADEPDLTRWFVLAAAVTGAASFMYEIGWIRMLSLVLGSTTHSFELMLSAFITGLAIGGFAVRNLIDRVRDPIVFCAIVQLLMGLLAMATLPLYALSFGWISELIAGLARSDNGYTLFTLASHALALLIMLPATITAGMTLPLFTHVLLKTRRGEKSIGQIYSANTVGAIVGVLFAVHIGLPWLGLKGLVGAGALLDIALGAVLLWVARRDHSARRMRWVFAAVVAWLAVLVAVPFRSEMLASGVYRFGSLSDGNKTETVFYRDGKTASVALLESDNNVLSLKTNGKTDAGMQMGDDYDLTGDEITMVLLGALPLVYVDGAVDVATIGMGSGLSTHAVLHDAQVQRVDTIEIEAAMVEASKGFGDRVELAHSDPRSHIHIDDAKAFFALRNSTYDVIISEPSNPWVSGVATLFSTEFYAHVKRYLKDDGVFVQWLQLYEFNDALAGSVLAALSEQFSDFALYHTSDADLILIATPSGTLPPPQFERIVEGRLGELLGSVGVNDHSDLHRRYLGAKTLVHGIVAHTKSPANSDYYPVVDLHAGQARFSQQQVTIMTDWALSSLPMAQLIEPLPVRRTTVSPDDTLARAIRERLAHAIGDALIDGNFEGVRELEPAAGFYVNVLRDAADSCTLDPSNASWNEALREVTRLALGHAAAPYATAMVQSIAPDRCLDDANVELTALIRFYHALAKRDSPQIEQSGRALLPLAAVEDAHRHQAIAALVTVLYGSGQIEQARQIMIDYRSDTDAAIAEGRVPLEMLRALIRQSGD
ncbi:MAG: spermidine synthase [Gammaproteobacteria bacterium]